MNNVSVGGRLAYYKELKNDCLSFIRVNSTLYFNGPVFFCEFVTDALLRIVSPDVAAGCL